MKENNNFFQKNIVIFCAALLCCFLWGSAFPCIKIGYKLFNIGSKDVFSQILFAGIRFFLAGILTIIIGSIIQKKFLIAKKSSIGMVCTLSLFQTIIQYFFFYAGLAHATGVKSSIINGMTTFFAILIACLVRKQEKLTPSKLIGCVLGIIGVVVVSLSGGSIGASFSFNGEGFILIAAVSYAISSVLVKEFSIKENPVVLSGYQFLFGGLVMIIAGFLFGGRISVTSLAGVILLIYMAMISAVAYSLWGTLLKYNSVSKVTIYGFTNPIFGALLSAIFLREYDKLNIYCLIALALVSAGIYVVNRSPKNK